MKPTTWHQMAEGMSNEPALQDLADDQVQAIVEALAFTIHADNKVAPLEVAGFNHLLFDLPWLEMRHDLIREHVPLAAQKARATQVEIAGKAHAEDIAQRLESPAVMEHVFIMAASLAQVDLKLDPAENLALARLGDAFGIERVKQKEIIEQLMT